VVAELLDHFEEDTGRALGMKGVIGDVGVLGMLGDEGAEGDEGAGGLLGLKCEWGEWVIGSLDFVSFA
jgi:hypothetical protein